MYKRMMGCFLAFGLLCGLLCMPAAAEVDDDCCLGRWTWDQSTEEEQAWMEITDVSETNAEFVYFHQGGGVHLFEEVKCQGVREGNVITAEIKEGAFAGRMVLRLYDDMIWVESFRQESALPSFCGAFKNPSFSLRTIEVQEGISVVLNGEKQVFANSPLMVRERVMLPLRQTFSAMEADVF